jgi:hypothetical protein
LPAEISELIMVGTGTGVGDGDGEGDGDGDGLGDGDCACADGITATASASAQASRPAFNRLRPAAPPSRCDGCDEQHMMQFPDAKSRIP